MVAGGGREGRGRQGWELGPESFNGARVDRLADCMLRLNAGAPHLCRCTTAVQMYHTCTPSQMYAFMITSTHMPPCLQVRPAHPAPPMPTAALHRGASRAVCPTSTHHPTVQVRLPYIATGNHQQALVMGTRQQNPTRPGTPQALPSGAWVSASSPARLRALLLSLARCLSRLAVVHNPGWP